MVDISFTIILQWVNFAVLLFLLIRFLYRPLLRLLDERRAKIKSALDSAARAQKEAEEVLAGYQAKMEHADQEAREIKSQASNEGLKEREKIIVRADEEASRIINRGREEVVLQEKEARNRLKKATVDLSISVAAKLLEKEIDTADQRRFVGQAIKEMESGCG